MKKLLFLLFLLATVPCVNATNLKVMTYNIRNGLGMDGTRDFTRIAEVINRQAPDIVAIQEVDSMTNRCDRRYVLAELATLTGMLPYYSPAIDYDGGKYGVGFLTRVEPIGVRRVSLPGREEKRTMIILEYDDYAVGDTHLSLTADDALASVPIIECEADSIAPKPFILMGDFNSEPHSDVIRKLMDRFVNVCDFQEPSFPSYNPRRRIDYILIANSPEAQILEATVVRGNLSSDHLPIVSSIALPTSAQE